MSNLSEDQVRERARVIWEREGRPHGRNQEHWRRAQEELRDELQDNVDRVMPDSEKNRGGEDNPIGRQILNGGDTPATPDIFRKAG